MRTHPQAQDNAAQSETVRTRAMIYFALAEAVAWPVAGIEDHLLNAVRTGERVLDSVACRRAALSLAVSHSPGLEALRKSYACLLASARPGFASRVRMAKEQVVGGLSGRPVALYESLHRQGRLAGPITWEVEGHYRTLGLLPDDRELPDHACVELAFLGHLVAAEAEAQVSGNGRLTDRLRVEQENFLRAHAGTWLPDVGAALGAAGHPFYAAVGRLLSAFLAEEMAGPKQDFQGNSRRPALKDPEACSLCGLCVGSCPSGALQVIESLTETTLALDPSRCVGSGLAATTGCDRCVRICPEETLTLSVDDQASSQAGAATGTGHGFRVLRQSFRGACPNCGQPTVSRAELNAVFTRLQADAALQHRLSLCFECKSWSVERGQL